VQECLPLHADHEWLKSVFSSCGNVVYVSVPRYKSSGDIKGFAFIEFDTTDAAEMACQVKVHFNGLKSSISTK
jgi:La-related protein 7